MVKLDHARVLAARKLLAGRDEKGQPVRRCVCAAEVILAGQVFDETPRMGENFKVIVFPPRSSGDACGVVGYTADYIDANAEEAIADQIGEWVFEAMQRGELPYTVDELEVCTKSAYS